ncbi:hypothetical protein DPMN_109512 [Dreissena polymorpha]|uniref:Uncharacterized protein n=1 Tax=Dreissena polymorpha TaxID=45954 RepID=A0A9D4KB65_DREPO|nr:hypothetical protein DPMN_109512 [Dreissena polymorpha]
MHTTTAAAAAAATAAAAAATTTTATTTTTTTTTTTSTTTTSTTTTTTTTSNTTTTTTTTTCPPSKKRGYIALLMSVCLSVGPSTRWLSDDNSRTLGPRIMKLHRYIDHDSQMTPIDFEVTRSKVKVTGEGHNYWK